MWAQIRKGQRGQSACRACHSLVEVDQEGEDVKADFDKALSCVEGELGPIHHLCRVVEAWPRHGGAPVVSVGGGEGRERERVCGERNENGTE